MPAEIWTQHLMNTNPKAKRPDWFWSPTSLLYNGHRGYIYIYFFLGGGGIGRGVLLTTHLQLQPRLRISGTTPLLPPYAFIVCRGTALTFSAARSNSLIIFIIRLFYVILKVINCVYLINTTLPCKCMEHIVFFRITLRVLLTLPCPEVTVSPTEIRRGVGNRCTVIQWQPPILSPAARQYTGARLTRSLCILGTSLKSKQCRPQGNQTLSRRTKTMVTCKGRGGGVGSGFTDSVPGVQAPLNRSQVAQKWYSQGGHCLILGIVSF